MQWREEYGILEYSWNCRCAWYSDALCCNPMTDFIERLPLRLAALAGLLVGAASVFAGADAWAALIRVGAAFFIFGILGLGLRALLREPPHPAPHAPHPASEPQDPDTGNAVDQKTPEMTIDDLK